MWKTKAYNLTFKKCLFLPSNKLWSSGQQCVIDLETQHPKNWFFLCFKVTAVFLITITENLSHAPGPRTLRHKGMTENKHPHFKNVENKIMCNELKARNGISNI